jgi:hypothetical protein
MCIQLLFCVCSVLFYGKGESKSRLVSCLMSLALTALSVLARPVLRGYTDTGSSSFVDRDLDVHLFFPPFRYAFPSPAGLCTDPSTRIDNVLLSRKDSRARFGDAFVSASAGLSFPLIHRISVISRRSYD